MLSAVKGVSSPKRYTGSFISVSGKQADNSLLFFSLYGQALVERPERKPSSFKKMYDYHTFKGVPVLGNNGRLLMKNRPQSARWCMMFENILSVYLST